MIPWDEVNSSVMSWTLLFKKSNRMILRHRAVLYRMIPAPMGDQSAEDPFCPSADVLIFTSESPPNIASQPRLGSAKTPLDEQFRRFITH